VTLDEAPVGTIVTVGHPANASTATKYPDGAWRYTFPPHRVVDYDDLHKTARAVYIPERA